MARAKRAPSDMKWVALAMAALYFVIWLYGGLIYPRGTRRGASSPRLSARAPAAS